MIEAQDQDNSETDGEGHDERSLIAIFIAVLCILFGSCLAISLVFWTGMIFLEVRENSSVAMAIAISTGMFVMGLPFVGILTYGITLLRRQMATADAPYDPFTGLVGLINALAGLALSGAMIVGLPLGVIVTLVARDWESFFILAGAAGVLFPIFYWLFRRCLAGLGRLREERKHR